jgi:hypothetical protein
VVHLASRRGKLAVQGSRRVHDRESTELPVEHHNGIAECYES